MVPVYIQLSNRLCPTVCAAFYVHTPRSYTVIALHWLLARTLIAEVSSLSIQLHALQAISRTSRADCSDARTYVSAYKRDVVVVEI